jgi:hypothetical protein
MGESVEGLKARLENGTDALASTHNCKLREGFAFRAELSTSGAERFDLTKV